jgi:hypothetical protein
MESALSVGRRNHSYRPLKKAHRQKTGLVKIESIVLFNTRSDRLRLITEAFLNQK